MPHDLRLLSCLGRHKMPHPTLSLLKHRLTYTKNCSRNIHLLHESENNLWALIRGVQKEPKKQITKKCKLVQTKK